MANITRLASGYGYHLAPYPSPLSGYRPLDTRLDSHKIPLKTAGIRVDTGVDSRKGAWLSAWIPAIIHL